MSALRACSNTEQIVRNHAKAAALAGMERFEAPRADLAILVFLIFVTSIAGCIGMTMYWMMQPTVIANVAFTEPKQTRSFLHDIKASPVPDMEQAALDVANEENAELGFKTPVVLAAAPAAVEPPPEPKKEVKHVAKPPKKRVAQVQRREPDARHAWGFNRGFFGYGGGWYW
jgi:hypothetical protein